MSPLRMEYEELVQELSCPICLEIFTDVVSLPCGHNFCRSCIKGLILQPGPIYFSCPCCRRIFLKSLKLEKKTTVMMPLNNIVDCFLVTWSPREDCFLTELITYFRCTQCNSVISGHPEYYCPQCPAFLCEKCYKSCRARGHPALCAREACENKKKELLRHYTDELTPQKARIQKRILNLQKYPFTFPIYRRICTLITEDALLSKKMCEVEEICHITDPKRLLHEIVITKDDFCGSTYKGLGDGPLKAESKTLYEGSERRVACKRKREDDDDDYENLLSLCQSARDFLRRTADK